MKKLNRSLKVFGIILSLALMTFPNLFAQDAGGSQYGFTYQAVARDDAGSPMESQELTVRISISEQNAEGVLTWQEDHDVVTNKFGLFSLVVGGPDAYAEQSESVESFGDIDWTATRYFLNVMVRIDNNFLDLGGSLIQTVPMAQFARTAAGSEGKFEVQADQVYPEGEALFEVKRSDGSVAFAVYEDMVWVYTKDDGTKGVKGGFAVGGYNTDSKGPTNNIMRITQDSIRMYISSPATKGVKGGFAVGGYNTESKAPGDQYLYVESPDPVDDDYSIALGVNALASGRYSTAIGYNSTASNTNSMAFGNSSLSSGTNATAIGYQASATGTRSIAIGSYYNYSFNFLPIIDYGKKGDQEGDTKGGLEGDSKGDFIIWYPIITPIWSPTISFSRQNRAEGQYSISLGNGNWSQDGGMALGSNNDAFGFGAAAIGHSNAATNTGALAAGYNSNASGYYATAIGNNANAQAYGSFVIGQYNQVGGDPEEWHNTDPLFVIGNGLNSSNKSNALTIYKNGKSIFTGENNNFILNDKRTFFVIGGGSATYIYGVRSYVNRNDPAVSYYYSGYFYDTGTEGGYGGLYADIRSGTNVDVAEYIHDSQGNTEAGDVLVADPSVKESAIVSNQPYQSSVIGVVSTEPHLTMGMNMVIDEETGNPLPEVSATRLALTGRVPCKVTDENGPIMPGDLVTTSSTPGHAMKWTLLDVNEAQDFDELKQMLAENETRRNAVIGKALEAHNGGTGEIVVLISLQ